MPTSASGGFSGKTLEIDLTTRTITAVNTLDASTYADYWGGAGMGYKAIWDKSIINGVPVAWDDPRNALTFAGGPLSGTGTPSGGRCAITALSPVNPWGAPTTGHSGGYFPPELKYAGWDGVVVTGKASGPVWIKIIDSNVEIVDQPDLWGQGLHRTWTELTEAMGSRAAQVMACGTAGQNMVPQSCCMTARSHSGGSTGSILGSKNLMGIGVLGTGACKIAASKKKWRSLVENSMAIIGSNNQAVVPNLPQPWSEYVSSSGTRWWGSKGRFWGAAAPAVETGLCEPHDRQSVGYRCWKVQEAAGADFKGDVLVRMDGCHACPIRCHMLVKIPTAEKWGVSQYDSNTCSGYSAGPGMMNDNRFAKVDGNKGTLTREAFDVKLRKAEKFVVGNQMQNDLGITFNYGLNDGNFKFLYDGEGINLKADGSKWGPGELYIKPNIPAAEWQRHINTGGLIDLYERGDLKFYAEFGRIVSCPNGTPLWAPSVLGRYIGGPQEKMLDDWKDASGNPIRKRYFALDANGARAATAGPSNYWGKGHPEHHLNGVVGLMSQTDYNRDPQQHAWLSFTAGAGLPVDVISRCAEDQFAKYGYGPGMGNSTSYAADVTPNIYHARAAKWQHAQKELIDGLGVCAWMYPFVTSPLKERAYEGDISLLSQFWSAATGDIKNTVQLDMEGERFWVLHRAITMLCMKKTNQGFGATIAHDASGNIRIDPPFSASYPWGVEPVDPAVPGGAANMRRYHDQMGPFEVPAEKEEWSEMNDLFYEEWGCDLVHGWPEPATYDKYGMGAIKTVMAAQGLLP